MSWLVVASVCGGLSALMAVVGPAAAMGRTNPAEGGRATVGGSLLRGREGSMARPWRLVGAGLASLGITALVPGVTGLLVAALLGVAVFVLAGQWVRPDPELDLLRRELPRTLDLLAVCIESGAPMPTAVRVVGPTCPRATRELLRGVGASLELGRSGAEAWQPLADHAVWGEAARDLARSARSGTSVEEGLRIHADEARRRRHEVATAAARAVGVKSVVPLMVCFLPAFVLVGVVPLIAGLMQSFFG